MPGPTTMSRSPLRSVNCWPASGPRGGAGPPARQPAGTVVKVGALDVDLGRRTARVEGGEPLKLTPREWDLLAALVRGGEGRVVTQRQLLTAVWGPAHVEDAQYLRVYIGHLRQKLGPAAGLIRTEPGVGYRFGSE
jgi:two-component system KDP operon response regulator KdpE